jgi:hypothetical protein
MRRIRLASPPRTAASAWNAPSGADSHRGAWSRSRSAASYWRVASSSSRRRRTTSAPAQFTSRSGTSVRATRQLCLVLPVGGRLGRGAGSPRGGHARGHHGHPREIPGSSRPSARRSGQQRLLHGAPKAEAVRRMPRARRACPASCRHPSTISTTWGWGMIDRRPAACSTAAWAVTGGPGVAGRAVGGGTGPLVRGRRGAGRGRLAVRGGRRARGDGPPSVDPQGSHGGRRQPGGDR